jgi:hypothetical protein
VGCIDQHCALVIPLEFEAIYAFRDGYAAAKRDGKFGVIDKVGKWRVEPRYDELNQAPGGWFEYTQGKEVGLFNLDGRVLKNPAWTGLGLPSEGVAPVEIHNQWGALDVNSGKVIIQPRWTLFRDFSEGLAYVEQGSTTGYIDTTGKMVFEMDAIYDRCGDFKNGLAYIRMKNVGEGYINRTGKWVYKRRLKS